MLNRGVTAAHGNLFQGQAGVRQEVAGAVQTKVKNVGLDRYAFQLFENAVQIGAVQTDMPGDILNGNLHGIAAVNIRDYLLHEKFFL